MLLDAEIAVVVPAFDEEAAIARTVGGVPSWVDLIVVVDDASRDGTFRLASASRDPRVHVVRHAENRGVGASLVTGYRRARALGADVVAVMAGDGQMDPADLERVVAPVARGDVDYVKGTRLVGPAVLREMPVHRAAATAVLGALTALATGVRPITDGQCGYTAIAGRALDALEDSLAREGHARPGRGLDAIWPRYGYPNDLLAAIARAGLSVREVPVRAVYGGEASGIRAVDVLRIGWLIARAAVRRARAHERGGEAPGPRPSAPGPRAPEVELRP